MSDVGRGSDCSGRENLCSSPDQYQDEELDPRVKVSKDLGVVAVVAGGPKDSV